MNSITVTNKIYACCVNLNHAFGLEEGNNLIKFINDKVHVVFFLNYQKNFHNTFLDKNIFSNVITSGNKTLIFVRKNNEENIIIEKQDKAHSIIQVINKKNPRIKIQLLTEEPKQQLSNVPSIGGKINEDMNPSLFCQNTQQQEENTICEENGPSLSKKGASIASFTNPQISHTPEPQPLEDQQSIQPIKEGHESTSWLKIAVISISALSLIAYSYSRWIR